MPTPLPKYNKAANTMESISPSNSFESGVLAPNKIAARIAWIGGYSFFIFISIFASLKYTEKALDSTRAKGYLKPFIFFIFQLLP
jgi:hypothetical protein